MGRRYLYLILRRNLLAGLNWRFGLPNANEYPSMLIYLRDFGARFTACYSEMPIVGCERDPSMLTPDMYNQIIVSDESHVDRYIPYLAPGGQVYLFDTPIYAKPSITVYVPCNVLTTHGGALSPIELYSIDWQIVGCQDVASEYQMSADIRICSAPTEQNCVDVYKVIDVIERFRPLSELSP